MKKKKWICLGLAAMLLTMTAGCRGTVETLLADSSEMTEATEITEMQESETPEESEEEASELYNTYIEINNMMVGRFNDVIVSYFKYVDFQEEFVLLEEDYWCLSNISTFYDSMERAYELSSQKTEKDAIDNAYLALYPVMKELASTIDEVEQYTELKSYVDDDYAKGKEYHAIIWEDYQQYETLAAEFMTQLSELASAKRMEDMERIKEEGYEGTYAVMKVISTAQEIQTAIYEQGIDDSRVIELDTEALKPLYDQYVEEVQVCLEYLSDEDAMAEEGFPVNSAYFSMFSRTVGESKLALTELFQRVEEQKPVDEFYLNSSFPDDGTIANFDEKVSEMINDYNHMLSY